MNNNRKIEINASIDLNGFTKHKVLRIVEWPTRSLLNISKTLTKLCFAGPCKVCGL